MIPVHGYNKIGKRSNCILVLFVLNCCLAFGREQVNTNLAILMPQSKLDLILSGSDKTGIKRMVITHMEEMILFAREILLWMNSFFS